MELHELLAREEIRDALARYVRGMDRLDLELALSAFHPGAIDHHGRNVGDPRETFPLIMERLRSHLADAHVLGSTAIVFESSTAATAETVAIGIHRLTGEGSSPPHDLQVGLRYVDRFELRDGSWRIVERHVIEDWRRADPVGAAPRGAFELGRRDRGDRSYLMGM